MTQLPTSSRQDKTSVFLASLPSVTSNCKISAMATLLRSVLSMGATSLIASGALLTAAPPNARAIDVFQELFLSLDVSGSVNDAQYNQYVGGYVNAFNNPAIKSQIHNTYGQGGVAIAVGQWDFAALTPLGVNWTQINNDTSYAAFVNSLASMPRQGSGGTCTGCGMQAGIDSILNNNFTATAANRRVIDISTDGGTSIFDVDAVSERDRAESNDIIINGLGIGAASTATLTDTVVTRATLSSKAGFVETAATAADFQTAIEAKLLRETGVVSSCTGFECTATGNNSQATGDYSTATGVNSQATGDQTTATGHGTLASGLQGTATGATSRATGNGSTATGQGSQATGFSSTATGVLSQASGESSTATGNSSLALGASSLALGSGATAGFNNSVAIGANTVAERPNQVIIASRGQGLNTVYTLPGLATGGAFAGDANQVTSERQTRFTTVDNQGNLGTSSFSVGDVLSSFDRINGRLNNIESALGTVNSQIQNVGAIAAALSAIPNLTTDNQRYGCGVGAGGYGSGWAGAAGCAAKIGNHTWVNGALAFTNTLDSGFGSTPSVAGRIGLFYQWGAPTAK